MSYTVGDLLAAIEAQALIDRMQSELGKVADFLEVTAGDAFDVPAKEAIDYFQRKGLATTFSYADMLGKAHDQAFTVAKMMDVDLLKQVRDSLDSALANGVPFGEWKKQLAPVLKSAGWWGAVPMLDPQTGNLVDARLGSAWRLETIFRTNLQTAYAAGQWGQIEQQAEAAPFLMYDAVDDFRTRPAHRAWDSTVLPVDSPWWLTHTPPCGYNCRCGVIQLDPEQLSEMGLTPRTEPPPEGSYNWTNPRTGQVQRVPEGIDPGFDRNPGKDLADQLREVLDEKIKTLPPDMQKALQDAARKEFDTRTTAGTWHRDSFDKAPDWLRNKVLSMAEVDVETASKTGAFARGGRMIDMDGLTKDKADGQSVWRHEFGHIMDARLGKVTAYRSSQDDFAAACKADGDQLAAAAGNGRKSKANTALRGEVVQAYEDAQAKIVAASSDKRIDVLRGMAQAAGLDYDQFAALVRESTLVLDDGPPQIGAAVRLARMIEAVRLGDGEGFVRWATFKDSVESMQRAGQYDRALIQATSQSWRKDGSIASLSDLVGASTKNRAANYHDGFAGHSNAYYRKDAYRPLTEAFANLTALAGHQNPYWWQLTQRFAPRMAVAYQEIIGVEA